MSNAPKFAAPFNLHGLKTYPLRERPSKVFVEDLGQPVGAGASVGDWVDSLPRQLAGNELRRVRDLVCRVHEERHTAVAAVGGHVIKTGCAPYLIDWVRRGLLQAVVLNGISRDMTLTDVIALSQGALDEAKIKAMQAEYDKG